MAKFKGNEHKATSGHKPSPAITRLPSARWPWQQGQHPSSTGEYAVLAEKSPALEQHPDRSCIVSVADFAQHQTAFAANHFQCMLKTLSVKAQC